jgi:hypothetical protein
MDRLTQLQDAIDKMALLFVSSLDHLTKNAPLVPLHPNVPVVSTGTYSLLASLLPHQSAFLKHPCD